MGSFSNYLEDKLLDQMVGKTDYTMPTVWVSLSTVNPDEDASGNAEPADGYARVETAGSDWNASSGGSISNGEDVTFGEASGDWGTITHFALWDALSGGNMLAYGALASSKHIESGEIAKFAGGTPGDLVLTLD